MAEWKTLIYDNMHTPDNEIGGVGNTKVTSIHYPWYQRRDWTGRYFFPVTTGVTKVASHMIVCAVAGTNHKTAASLRSNFIS